MASELAERVVVVLRAHEAELRQAGIMRLSLFGSVARSDDTADSDIDLVAELDRQAGIGLLAFGALERHLGNLLGRKVDLLAGPPENPRLRAAIEQDSICAF